METLLTPEELENDIEHVRAQRDAYMQQASEANNAMNSANIRVSVLNQKLSEVENENIELRVQGTSKNIEISSLRQILEIEQPVQDTVKVVGPSTKKPTKKAQLKASTTVQ